VKLKTYISLFRFILLLSCIQFVTPFVNADMAEPGNSQDMMFHQVPSQSILSSLFMEELKPSREDGDGGPGECVIADFTFLETLLNNVCSINVPSLSVDAKFDHHPPLFVLHRIFMI
jgi:hypothetical protein